MDKRKFQPDQDSNGHKPSWLSQTSTILRWTASSTQSVGLSIINDTEKVAAWRRTRNQVWDCDHHDNRFICYGWNLLKSDFSLIDRFCFKWPKKVISKNKKQQTLSSEKWPKCLSKIEKARPRLFQTGLWQHHLNRPLTAPRMRQVNDLHNMWSRDDLRKMRSRDDLRNMRSRALRQNSCSASGDYSCIAGVGDYLVCCAVNNWTTHVMFPRMFVESLATQCLDAGFQNGRVLGPIRMIVSGPVLLSHW